MSGDFKTIWLQQTLQLLATTLAQTEIQRQGRALPCEVTAVNVDGFASLVTVEFQVQGGPWTLNPITIPKFESQWFRIPTQVGDLGMTVPADTFLGGISGQGAGIADLTVDYGNLSNLIFVPLAITTFPDSPDLNKAWANGPNGGRIGDSANGCYVDCDAANNTVTIVAGGKTWTFTSSGFTDSDGIVQETHLHGGVTTGSAKTTGPTT